MSGIVAYIGDRNAVTIATEGLTIMERLGLGYDSAGIALNHNGRIRIKKSTGMVSKLMGRLPKSFRGHAAIAHTRWATFGKPSDVNAHPLTDCEGNIAIVHTGLIVNFDEQKRQLQADGHQFVSETDSELIAHLIEAHYHGDLETAVRDTLMKLEGTYGIAVLHKDHPDRIICAASGSSLILGIGEGEMLVASDVQVLAPYNLKIYYLQDQEMVSFSRNEYEVRNVNLVKHQDRPVRDVPEQAIGSELGEYAYYFEKEMMDQPNAIQRSLSGRIIMDYGMVNLQGLDPLHDMLHHLKRILLTGSGTSYNAAMVASNWFQSIARIPSTFIRAGEFANANPMIEPETLYVMVSQSGETAGTIAAMRETLLRGGRVMGVCNRISSTLYRETEAGIYLRAGIEFAVPATKSFTVELVALGLMTIMLGRMRHISAARGKEYLRELEALPEQLQSVLKRRDEFRELARRYIKTRQFLFLGFGPLFGIAKEASLKVREMLNIPADGLSSAEIHHGPIAVVDHSTPLVMLIPRDDYFEKNRRIYTRLMSRNMQMVVITDCDPAEFSPDDVVISIPSSGAFGYPVLSVVALQMLIYEIALLKGKNVDHPRLLQKVVNVE